MDPEGITTSFAQLLPALHVPRWVFKAVQWHVPRCLLSPWIAERRMLEAVQGVSRQLEQSEANGEIFASGTFNKHVADLQVTWNQIQRVASSELKIRYGRLFAKALGLSAQDPTPNGSELRRASMVDHWRRWKRSRFGSEREPNAQESAVFDALAGNAGWCWLLEQFPSERERLFKWCFRDGLPLRAWVSFPATAEKLQRAMVSGAFGFAALGDPCEQLETHEEDGKKDLRWRGKNLADPETKVSENFTVQQFLQESGNKNAQEPHIVVSADDEGFQEFHPVQGNGEKPRFFDRVPPMAIFSEEQFNQLYPNRLQDNLNIYVDLCSSRSNNDYRAINCHAYLTIYERRDGQIFVYHVGSYAPRFPQGGWEGYNMLGETHQGVISYADQSGTNTAREQVAWPIQLTTDQAEELLGEIQRLADKGYNFQLTGKNCTYRLWKILKKANPALEDQFRQALSRPVLENRLGVKWVDRALDVLERVPGPGIATAVLRALLYLVLRSWRTGTVPYEKGGEHRERSINDYRQNHGNILYNPSLLFCYFNENPEKVQGVGARKWDSLSEYFSKQG